MINNVVLMGRICNDIELKTTSNGISYTHFRLAVDRQFSKEKQTDFINIDCWRSTAEFVNKYFHKGSLIALTGRIETQKYQDKNGNNRTITKVIADNVSFTGEKNNKKAENNTTNIVNEVEDFENVDLSDDLPF